MHRLLSILAVMMLVVSLGTAQGIEFFHGTWEEALEEAQKQNKAVFVDCYTTWCGPCKRMAANVFTLKEVGDFFNENFINYKLDMEKPMGREFAREYPVSAYPTFFWIDGNGAVILNTKGARQPEDFLALAEDAAKKYDGSAKYRTMYEEGNRDYEVVYGYITQLVKADKSPVRIANDFLKDQEDITTPENLTIILAAAWQVDSKVFTYLEDNKKAIVKLSGQEAFDEAVRRASGNTVKRAVEYESPELIDEANAAMKKHLPKEADEFELRSAMDYAIPYADHETYYANAKPYVKKYIDDKAGKLNTVAVEVLEHFHTNPECVEIGARAAGRAVELKPKEKYILTYATLTFLSGDKDGAIKILDDTIEGMEPNDKWLPRMRSLKKQFKTA